jgi:TolB-like protein/Tfp pilus assembly protein PilF
MFWKMLKSVMAPDLMPEPQAVRAELERVLASAPFAGSHRSQRFLTYVVENSFEDAHESLKEYAIAVEVFERDASYDPAIDATVRVEAGRLRARLREYYAEQGRNDTLVIDVPKGSYRATFVEREVSGSAPAPADPQRGIAAAGQVAASTVEISAAQGQDAGVLRRMLRWEVAAALVLCAFLGWALLGHSRHLRSAASAKAPIVLAVLPFSNQTGSDANNYVTDGLTDNLIRQLSELPRLHVMARTAVERASRQAVVSQLGVKVLLVGKLRRNSEGRLVLDSELSNANGTILRSSQYMADESDMPSVQADVVQDVIQGLGIELDARQSAGAQKPITSSPAAFQAFLRGDSAARDPSPQGMHAALLNYEEAIRQDPQFALAYSAMANSHTLLGLYYEPARDHMPLARQYAERALAIDPSIHEAHGTLGLIHLVYDWDYGAAEKELAASDARESAIRALSCTAHLHLLGDREHMRHAEEDLYRMLEFDPHSPGLINELGCVSYYEGRYEASIRYYREAIAADPQAAITYWGLGRSLAREGHYSEALETLRRFKAVNGFEPPIITAEIGYSEALSGDRRAALATVARLQQESAASYVDPYLIAIIYLGLRDYDNTYAWLNRAYAARSSFLISITTDPRWSGSRSDPRFEEIWNRMTESSRHVAALSSPASTTTLQ